MPRPHALALVSLLLAAIPGGILATPVLSQSATEAITEATVRPAGDQRLDDFRWQNRLVIVFADTAQDPAFAQQMRWIAERPGDLESRDVIVLTDTDPATPGPLRDSMRPRGFSVVLVDKDGIVNQRKPFPQELRELTRAIDRMPVRQEEIRRQRFGG